MPRRKSPGLPDDAISIVSREHRRLRRLFGQLARSGRDDAERRRELAALACNELAIHAAVEEALFYPAARRHVDRRGQAMVDRAAVEHALAGRLLAELERIAPADPRHAATLSVLGRYVGGHFARVERKLFPQLCQTDIDLAGLGAAMRARRSALVDGETAPGQIEPSADAAGANEPVLDDRMPPEDARA